MLRAMEAAICYEYFDFDDSRTKGPVPEEQCKVDQVQQRLVMLVGLLAFGGYTCGTSVEEASSRAPDSLAQTSVWTIHGVTDD